MVDIEPGCPLGHAWGTQNKDQSKMFYKNSVLLPVTQRCEESFQITSDFCPIVLGLLQKISPAFLHHIKIQSVSHKSACCFMSSYPMGGMNQLTLFEAERTAWIV